MCWLAVFEIISVIAPGLQVFRVSGDLALQLSQVRVSGLLSLAGSQLTLEKISSQVHHTASRVTEPAYPPLKRSV